MGVYESSPETLTNDTAAAILLDINRRVQMLNAYLNAGENLTINKQLVEQQTNPTFISASTLIATGASRYSGIFVSIATSTPTLKVWNNTAASGTVLVETFTPVAGTLYTMGAMVNCSTGIYVTISGTVSCTVLWNQ